MRDKRRTDPKQLGNKRGYITVEIEKSTYLKLIKNADTANLSIRKFVNKMIDDNFSRDEFLRKVAPKLSLLDFISDSILIKDSSAKKDRLATIKIQEGRLFCDFDEKYDCQHIHFVLTLPQLVSIKDKLDQI